MEIKPVYVFYGEDKGRIQIDVDFFRDYFRKEGCYTDTFDGTKTELSEILLAAEDNPLFGERRLLIVSQAPWFGNNKKKEKEEKKAKTVKTPPWEPPLLAYLADPNPNICLVFLCEAADKRKKATKAAAVHGTVREYKAYKDWELPEFVRKCCRNVGKTIDGKSVELLISLVGNDTAQLNNEIKKLALYLDDQAAIGEAAILKVVSHTASATMFQLSDAIGDRNFLRVAALCDTMLPEEMKQEEAMALFGYLTNHIRLLMEIKELLRENGTEKTISEALHIHSYRIQKSIPAAKRYTMTELAAALNAMANVEFLLKSGSGEFTLALRTALLHLVSPKDTM